MNLQYRIDLLSRLGDYMLSADEKWQQIKEKASYENGWFTPEFTALSISNISSQLLSKQKLTNWVKPFFAEKQLSQPLQIGIIMAGNIPLVGFHDFLSVFLSGHKMLIKPSLKDSVLIKHLAEKLNEWEPELYQQIQFAEILKGCDVYIATGSNNSSRYFEYYFGKYPHIIRRNKTSVAILDGTETKEEMEALADDVFQYFGLGCRNVSKLMVPEGFDFVRLLDAFSKYLYLADHHKYKNNYDYNLALHILNKKYYMTNGAILLTEDSSVFSPISQLHFEYYKNAAALNEILQRDNEKIQAVAGKSHIPFGHTQCPGLIDYADGINTLEFLASLTI
ncbi:MAG: acyl-CoA reductase [Chitinophagaceae bacterium]